MKRKVVSRIVLLVLLTSMLPLTFDFHSVKSDWTWTETIFIRADGSVDPDIAPISSVDNITYTLTDNIVGDVPERSSVIVVEKDNIVVDGIGYTLQGLGDGTGMNVTRRRNVTIKNIEIKAFDIGIYLSGSSNSIIQGNEVTNNRYGIDLHHGSSNNAVYENRLTNNYRGIWLYSTSNNTVYGNDMVDNDYGIRICFCAPNNKIYHNNFVQNWVQAFSHRSINIWDDGYPSGGNYWSDYVDRYPDAQELDDSGIWDTPYVIDENNQDNYPLMNPWTPAPTVITATIDIDPDTLNLKSKGKWITCYIELPEGYDVSDIDRASILLNDTFPVDPFWVNKPLESVIGDYDEDGIPDLMVKFKRAEVIELISAATLSNDKFIYVTITITGQFYDGTPFEGYDTIRNLPIYKHTSYKHKSMPA